MDEIIKEQLLMRLEGARELNDGASTAFHQNEKKSLV